MNLQEIKEREAKATPGFWVNMGEYNSESVFFGEIRCGGTPEQETFTLIAVMPHLDDRTDDFNFIAHAREDVPALIAEIERLQAENEQLKNRQQKLYAALQNIISCFSESDIEFLFDEDAAAMDQLLTEARIAVS